MMINDSSRTQSKSLDADPYGDAARLSAEELTALAVYKAIATAIKNSGYDGPNVTASTVADGLRGLTARSAAQIVEALLTNQNAAIEAKRKEALHRFDLADKVFTELLEMEPLPNDRRAAYEKKRSEARSRIECLSAQKPKDSEAQAFKFQGTC